MSHQTVQFRTAVSGHVEAAIPLIYSSGPAAFDGSTALPFLLAVARQIITFYGFSRKNARLE